MLPKICVFGCGSLGANTVINIARRLGDGVRFVLVDYDRIESVNIANQPWYDVNIGQRKSSTLAAYVYRVNASKCDIVTDKVDDVSHFLQKHRKILKDCTLCVDFFDNLPGRRLTQHIADALEVPIMHGGFAETIFLSRWGKAFPLNEKSSATAPICNRQELGTLVTIGAGIAAHAVVQCALKGIKKEAVLEVAGEHLTLSQAL